MKISFLQNKPISFGRNKIKEDKNHSDYTSSPYGFEDERTLGFDDKPSKEVRDYMREHLFNTLAPNYYYHSQTRLSEYELKKLTADLNRKPKINYSVLKDVFIPNLTDCQEDGLRGAALHERLNYLPELKKAGVRRVINLAYNSTRYEKACLECGLEYLSFPFRQGDFWTEAACMSEEDYLLEETRYTRGDLSSKELIEIDNENRIKHKKESRKTIESVIKFIQTIQKGNYYIGCANGRIATDQALILNRYFNPENKLYSTSIFGYEGSCLIQDGLRGLYENFTENDKKRLGFTPGFEAQLKEKLEIED